VLCSEVRVVAHRDDDGRPACAPCYAKMLRKRETCAQCDEWSIPARRDDGGRAYCMSCYRAQLRPKHECRHCGEVALLTSSEHGACSLRRPRALEGDLLRLWPARAGQRARRQRTLDLSPLSEQPGRERQGWMSRSSQYF